MFLFSYNSYFDQNIILISLVLYGMCLKGDLFHYKIQTTIHLKYIPDKIVDTEIY